MACNSDVQQRLREEVLSVLGPSAVPTGKQLQELLYAKNIITETLRCVVHACVCEFLHECVLCTRVCVRVWASSPCRLRPLVSGNMRELDSPIVLDGHEIPKGVNFRLTYVLCSIACKTLSRMRK